MAAETGKSGALWVYASREAWRRVKRRFGSGPGYRWRFSGRAPERILVAPPDLRLADPQVAIDMYHGRFMLAGQMVEAGGISPFQIAGASLDWQRALHGFRWLRHMREAGTELAAAHARALTGEWMASHGGRISDPAWEIPVVARRIIAWLQHSTTVLQGAELPFYRAYLRNLMAQVRFLRVAVREMPDGEERLRARIALAFAALALPGSAQSISSATRNLALELDRQILPDGGHISRNPDALLELLADLLPLRQTYANQAEAPPKSLMDSIDRMFPALRFFRHTDGNLARFNGMGPTIADRLAAVLHHDDTGGSPLLHAPYSGYERLAMGGTTLIADTGTPPPFDVSGEAHAGCLSFEFSSGRQQFVVNCGVDVFGPPDYRPLARATAAHSTATINDNSSARFQLAGRLRELLGTPLYAGPTHVVCERRDSAEAQTFIASHNGYESRYGLVHERDLTLSMSGSIIEGIDRIRRRDGQRARIGLDAVVIRFHLHPDTSMFQDEQGRLVVGVEGGDFWTFSCQEVEPRFEDSIFFAAASGPRRSRQISLTYPASQVEQVTWRFTRIRIGA
ncbi:MAG: heparinase II/III family protein [Mesorhizobium sp.]